MSIRETQLAAERGRLAPHATRSDDPVFTSRLHAQGPDDIRTEFERDYNRIIHSRAFRRLRHKTQVFISPKNDHLCTRLEHSLHVASVGVTVAKALGLNCELVQAIAAGHDLGHAPFGHAGERFLDELAAEHGLRFQHELQGLRIVDCLESPYQDHRGLNLTFAVRDGVACHYGEGFEPSLTPDRSKRPESLGQTERGLSCPATVEGCVVRWADKIAYLGRDLEDAVELGLIDRQEIPDSVRRLLGTTNGEIIGVLVRQLVACSTPQALKVSDEVHLALNELYRFNMEKIYESPKASAPTAAIPKAMRVLFEELIDRINRAKQAGDTRVLNTGTSEAMKILSDFLVDNVRTWQTESAAQLTVDFIAGMTDSFFMRAFNELFFPQALV